MQVLETISDLREYRKNVKESVGFVPTMGALHKGHQSLIERSLKENFHTITSVFVNPTQFGANEDFSAYPRPLEKDLALCEKLGVDVVFVPKISEMYPYKSEQRLKLYAPKFLSHSLEGAMRKGHFDGVAQVVLRLFHLVNPTRAYFGKKDAQQLLIIQHLVKDLLLDIEIVPCEIVRDSDHLALSSRNVYLNAVERKQALAIPKALENIQQAIDMGEKACEMLKKIGLEILKNLEVDYLEFCNHKLEPLKIIEPTNTLILVAARAGKTRLLDNLWV
ncbi:pantoate--beta-alanine ligase [Helicobacter acinonychis]|uniref:Pantothenate synthetase n=1 Tax=Helicobacter acinonychis (strain Sheeba) TaxID=382638 RepID=PANC_HELAH|nr:pantoate--beta-alanine ligase [Helicobacter acinonychis]Q17Z21.1 RecName: Full=Pantothenate synthetase; Short=PS; AltName: Full=Pantoate--beta-alanine ligase; AltName: Full=Pantoate-activating enzyme [Helicobacter acinonychis str. Sheeba]CAJ99105.1 pantoate--beta-alanine ligase [Helicobacter acinonychis str. Sheeba]STP04780.1 pantoate--beta-alanine ligase [Helicobacter acinonychis]